jgi:hypothetical protein
VPGARVAAHCSPDEGDAEPSDDKS